MDVKRPDLQHEGRPRVKYIVHAYRHQHDFLTDQMDQYKGRTTLNREDLKNGTITLRISSVGPSDSGRYKIFVPQLNASRLVDITVCENRTNTSTSGPPVEDVTEPDSPDAAETEAVRTRRSHIPSVCAAAAAVVLVLVLVLVLVKCLNTRKLQCSALQHFIHTSSSCLRAYRPTMRQMVLQTEAHCAHQTSAVGLQDEFEDGACI